jgi:hypothetical protein
VTHDELSEIRQSVAEMRTALALHDQKVDANVVRIADSQERLVAAVERIGDATIAIKALTEQMKVNGTGKHPHAALVTQPSLPLNRQTVTVGLVVLLVAAVAAGGGSELVHALIKALVK